MVRNCSQLPAKCKLNYNSKIINSSKSEILIPPKQMIEIKLEIYPRKVNPEYNKEIIVANLLNRDNDATVHVTSTNIDKQHITFHSLYYHIVTPSTNHFLDFGAIFQNSSVVRSLKLENISRSDLTLKLSSSVPNDLLLFSQARTMSRPLESSNILYSTDRRERLFDTIPDKRKPTRSPSELGATHNIASSITKQSWNQADVTQTPESVSPYLDLASALNIRAVPFRRTVDQIEYSRKDQRSNTLKSDRYSISSSGVDTAAPEVLIRKDDDEDIGFDIEKIPFESLLTLLEKESGMLPPVFSKQSLEEKYVKTQGILNRVLQNRINDGVIVPVSTIIIPVDTSITVIFILNPKETGRPISQVFHNSFQGKSTSLDAHIHIEMIEFNRDLHFNQYQQILNDEGSVPLRDLAVRYSLSRSVMDIAQKNINFGQIDKNERRTKRIVIKNNSEIPLLYRIKKSGSIASGYIIFEQGRYGVIRGYAKREVFFDFDPSLPGLYQEKLIIENVRNPENTQFVVVKANVKQQGNFSISTMVLDFGVTTVNQASFSVQEFSVANITKQARTFEIKVDSQDLIFKSCIGEIMFDVSDDGVCENLNDVIVTKETEDLIEQLDQKLKIAIRKGREDKALKISNQLALLRSGKSTEGNETLMETSISATPDSKSLLPQVIISTEFNYPPGSKSRISTIKKTDNSIVVSVAAGCIRDIKAKFRSVSGAVSTTNNSPRSSNMEKGPTATISAVLRITVNESKNSDSIKVIQGMITIYPEICSAAGSVNSDKHDGSGLVSPRFGSFGLDSVVPESAVVFLPVVVETANIDLGRQEVGEIKECYAVIKNRNNYAITYGIIAGKNGYITIGNNAGNLNPNETRKVDLSLKVHAYGQQVISFCILSDDGQYKTAVNFAIYGIASKYLNFDVSELYFGTCYFEEGKRFAGLKSFNVENVTNDTVFVTAVSNLSQQCYIFYDSNYELPFLDVPILPGESQPVYVALQPNFGTTNKKMDESDLKEVYDSVSKNNLRKLVGGIRFSIFKIPSKDYLPPGMVVKAVPSHSGLVYQSTQILKFSAVIGHSVLTCSTQSINFGTSFEMPVILRDRFKIENKTFGIPLEFSILSSNSILRSGIANGTLLAMPNDDSSEENARNSNLWVDFELLCQKQGFISEKFELINKNNTSNRILIHVCAFIDSELVKIKLAGPIQKAISGNATLKWQDIYMLDSNNVFLSGKDIPIEIENCSDHDLDLVPYSNLPFRTKPDLGIVSEQPCSLLDYSQCGMRLKILPKAKVAISFTTPLLKSSADSRDFSNGKYVEQFGNLVLINVLDNQVVKVLDVSASYCLSKGVLSAKTIDLGRVGHFNGWAIAQFTFEVENMADIPLSYSLEIPDFVDLESETGGTRGLMSSRISKTFNAIFNPRNAASAGPGYHFFKILIRNENNSLNDMELIFKFFMTEADLRFERLVSGQLILPPLVHPAVSGTLPCDTWFAVTNVTDQETVNHFF